MPLRGQGNDCTFRIVRHDEWAQCRWPRPDFERWHPTGTPTFKDGKAICPRCGHLMEGDEVKQVARSHEGGLSSQLYAVCSKVPVKLTYRDDKVKPVGSGASAHRGRRISTPSPPPRPSCAACCRNGKPRASFRMKRCRGTWRTSEPREYGMSRWRDFFLPRQLLTNLVILEEIRAAQERAKADLPADQAEAVGVYLAFILDKVVSYNNVCTTWHSGRKTVRSNFSRSRLPVRGQLLRVRRGS